MECWNCGRTLRPGAPICQFCGVKQRDDDDHAGAPARVDAPVRGSRATGRPDHPERPAAGREREPEERRARDRYREDAPAQSPGPPLPRPHDPDATTPRGDRRPPRLPSRPIDRDHGTRDPFDDPRAPRALRHESAPVDNNRRPPLYPPSGGQGPASGNRYDESAEQPAPRWSGGRYPAGREERPQGAGPDDPWSDPRGGRAGDPRDRGGYGRESYGRDQYAPPAPNWRDDSAGYSAEYSAEYGTQQGGWTDERTVGAYRGQDQGGWGDPRGGYRDGQGWDRGYENGARYAGAPVEDSGTGPAVGGYWEPSEEIPAPPARRGGERRGSRSSGRSGGRKSKQRAAAGRGGSPAQVISLVAVILAALVGGAALKFTGIIGGGGIRTASCPPVAAFQAPGPATTPSQYKAYTSPTSHFTLSYPQQWAQTSETSTAAGDYVDRFSTSDAKSSLAVEQASGFVGVCDSVIIEDEVTGGQNDGSTFVRLTSPAATMSIGGATWQRRDYEVTPKTGDKVHMAVLSTHHAGKGYAIVMYSAPATFAADEKATFSVILNAFRFVG